MERTVLDDRDLDREETGDEVPIQIEDTRDDGRLEREPEVVADRTEQTAVEYRWDDETAREQENLPEDEQQA